ncbi:hypothetical protein ACP70R_009116 [Stipagrostis hirtigluma subsp. patula]
MHLRADGGATRAQSGQAVGRGGTARPKIRHAVPSLRTDRWVPPPSLEIKLPPSSIDPIQYYS